MVQPGFKPAAHFSVDQCPPGDSRSLNYTFFFSIIEQLFYHGFKDLICYCLNFFARFRRFLIAVCEHKYFDYVVLLFILTSCVALALEEPNMNPKVEPGKYISIYFKKSSSSHVPIISISCLCACVKSYL